MCAGPGDVLQFLAVGLLALVAMGCLHGLLYHLHAILVPFVLSAFIVLGLQPMVDLIYELLSGKVPPYRWCICCRRRPLRRRSGEDGVPMSPGLKTCEEECCGSCSRRGFAFKDALSACCCSRETEPLLVTPRLGSRSLSEEGCCEGFLDALCRGVAVTVALLSVAAILTLVVLLIVHGAMHMKEHAQAYSDGLRKLERRQDGFVDTVSEDLRLNKKLERRLKDGYNIALEKTEKAMWESINSIIFDMSEGIFLTVWITLYVLFWLFQPLPFAETAGNLVRSYMYKKTLVSALYGLCVTLLFFTLGIDLAVLFGVVSFFLNYVPEVGAIISMAVPIPVILLDGRIENPFFVLSLAVTGQLTLKFLFGNILEVKLVEQDQVMSIHPVWVVFGLSYFGFVWGPIGMLISVPMLALVKTAATSAIDPGYSPFAQEVGEGLLACLEGRRPVQRQKRPSEEGPSASQA